MTVNVQPITYVPYIFIDELKLIWNSNTSIKISPGLCRDSTDSWEINNSATITVDMTKNGVNGLDKGSLVIDTWYPVFLIASSLNLAKPAAIVSSVALNAAGKFVMPNPYDIYRFIGWVKTSNLNTNVLSFFQYGRKNLRIYQWDVSQQIVNTGIANNFTAISTLRGTPPLVTSDAYPYRMYLTALYSAGSGDSFSIRPTGSTVASGITSPIYFQMIASGSSATGIMQTVVGTSGSNVPSIDFRTVSTSTGTLTLNVSAFEYYL